MSSNGLDWTLADQSTNHTPDENNGVTVPLTISCDAAEMCVGGTECYVRIVMKNSSGITTGVSNSISNLNVCISLGESRQGQEQGADSARQAFSQACRQSNGHVALLDSSLPIRALPPFYYQDVDGYLLRPDSFPFINPNCLDALLIQRVYTTAHRTPLGLAVFVRVQYREQPLAFKLSVDADSTSSRQLEVLWTMCLWGLSMPLPSFRRKKSSTLNCPQSAKIPHTAFAWLLMTADR